MTTQSEEYISRFQVLDMTAKSPYTTKEVAKIVQCSLSTAYRLIHRHWSGFLVWRPGGYGNFFYAVHFPSGTTLDVVVSYLDRNCKRGKSRATIHEISSDDGLVATYTGQGSLIKEYVARTKKAR